MTTHPCWIWDRAARLRKAARHAEEIRDALIRRRCDHVEAHDLAEVAEIDRRIAEHHARFHRLARAARAERLGLRGINP
jgi:hypothetical protein